MAQKLGQVAEGKLVKIKEDGKPVEFYVAKHDYESGMNGTGKTLLVRKDLYSPMPWNPVNYNRYSSSAIDGWLNGEYKNMLDADIRALILGTEIHVTLGGGVSSVGNTNRFVFLLSTTELGVPGKPYMNVEGTELITADTLRKSDYGQLTRSPDVGGTTHFWCANSSGNGYSAPASYSSQFRTAFTLPALQVFVSEDGTLSPNSAPSTPGSINIPDVVFLGAPVSVSWSAASDPNGNLSGYELQRSINDSGWVQVYKGTNTSYKDTLPGNSTKVQYRVRAYDDLGAGSGWRTSPTTTVYGPPTISTTPTTMQGQPITVSWSAVNGADSYVLQRKADGGGWEQVYAGAETSYTDTAGSWTTVQYQVCGVFGGVNGAFAVSPTIQVLPASALSIGGTDGDLGALTSDVPYSVATNTGKNVTVDIAVNGVNVFHRADATTYTGTLSVLDLPTGMGSIVIAASVQADSGQVTATRTWTYTKPAQPFPASGGVAALTKDGKPLFPQTLAECVRTIGGPWGGNLSTALSKLSMAATYSKKPISKYSEVKVDLSKAKAGNIVNLPENGVMVPFYVGSVNYEPTLNTSGNRVLLVRKNVYQEEKWNASIVNTYAGSTIDNWFNNIYKPMLDSAVLSQMSETTFEYTPMVGDTSKSTLSRAVFALSGIELGVSLPDGNTEGRQLPIAASLQIAYKNGVAITQWTRSPLTSSTNTAYALNAYGGVSASTVIAERGYRPCFTLPTTFRATYYADAFGNVHPSQEYTNGGDFYGLWGEVIPTVKIATGSYVGTGTYGISNKNTLTFPFEPKVVFIGYGDTEAVTIRGSFCFVRGAYTAGSTVSSSSSYTVLLEWDGNTVSWYSGTNQGVQLNATGKTYYYVAIG